MGKNNTIVVNDNVVISAGYLKVGKDVFKIMNLSDEEGVLFLLITPDRKHETRLRLLQEKK